MKNFIFDISLFLDDKTLWEMANVHPKTTGLKYHIHLYGKDSQTRHGPRVKVSNIAGKFDRNDNFSLSISHDPEVLNKKQCKIPNEHLDHIKDWVRLNHDHLHSMWHNYETQDTAEEISKLRKV